MSNKRQNIYNQLKKTLLYLRFKVSLFFKTIKPTRAIVKTGPIISIMALGLIFIGFVSPGQSKQINAWESTNFLNGPPEFKLLSAYGFQNIYTNGDILFLSRIFLQQDADKSPATHPTYQNLDWCDLLVDNSGCSSTPVNPTSPDRIDLDEITSQVPLTFNLLENGQVMKIESYIPRINYGFVGIYLENASISGFTITNNVSLCLQPNVNVWSTNTAPDCKTITVLDGRSIMKETLLDEVALLERELKLSKFTLINQGNLITYTGNKYVDEGAPLISRVIGGIFETGLDRIVDSTPVPTGTKTDLGTSIQNDYTTSGLKKDIDDVARFNFGVDGSTLLILIFGFFALMGAIASYFYTRSGQLSFIIFGSVMLIGFWTGTPSVGVLFVAITIMALFSTAYVLRKFPS